MAATAQMLNSAEQKVGVKAVTSCRSSYLDCNLDCIKQTHAEKHRSWRGLPVPDIVRWICDAKVHNSRVPTLSIHVLCKASCKSPEMWASLLSCRSSVYASPLTDDGLQLRIRASCTATCKC